MGGGDGRWIDFKSLSMEQDRWRSVKEEDQGGGVPRVEGDGGASIWAPTSTGS